MKNIEGFLSLILDSITDQITVIDELGDIRYVNKGWSTFGDENDCTVQKDWTGINYLDECDKAASMGDSFGLKAASGIRSVINKERIKFYFEYPCHSPNEKRWFMMRVTPLKLGDKFFYVISHQNITERKLAEEEVRNLARIDGLTGINNRRSFDEFLNEEYRRCTRLNKQICLAIIDLDNFKLLNDNFGHQAGDKCLIKIAKILKSYMNRPSDLCARFGGDEFVVVLGDTPLDKATIILNKILKEIERLKIVSRDNRHKLYITTSIGLSEASPSQFKQINTLLARADSALYLAKNKGKNRIAF